jgi:hypothetical protein
MLIDNVCKTMKYKTEETFVCIVYWYGRLPRLKVAGRRFGMLISFPHYKLAEPALNASEER